MNDFKQKFIKGYNNNLPQLINKNLVADVETPISSLLKISKNQKYSFLLESVEGGSKRGRYSLLGCDPDLIWSVEKGKAKIRYLGINYNYKFNNDPLKSLKELVNLSKFKKTLEEVPYPTLVGYLGYPMIQYMENIKLRNKDKIKIPDAILIRPKIVAVFDNIKDDISLMSVSYPCKKISAEKAFKDSASLLSKTIKKYRQY